MATLAVENLGFLTRRCIEKKHIRKESTLGHSKSVNLPTTL